jgi:DNA-binding NarL/FixJ family response regulator
MRAGGIRAIPRGTHSSTQQNAHGLTRRESQIFLLLRDGLANAAIAKALFISTRTVDHHVSAILAKLGAESRTQAIEIARRRSQTSN